MYLIANQRAKTSVNELVPRERPLSRKFLGYHQRLKMRVVSAVDLDGRVIKTGLYQATYLDWIHAGYMLR